MFIEVSLESDRWFNIASLFWEEEELDLADTNLLGVGDDRFGGKYPQDDGSGGVEWWVRGLDFCMVVVLPVFSVRDTRYCFLTVSEEAILCGEVRQHVLTYCFRLCSHTHFSPKLLVRLHGPESWIHSWQPLINLFISLPLPRFCPPMVSHHSHQIRRTVVTRRLPHCLRMGLLNSNYWSRAPEVRRKNQEAWLDNGSLQIHSEHTSHHHHPTYRQNWLPDQWHGHESQIAGQGLQRGDTALTVLIDFPFEISLGCLAGRWSTVYPPIHVWCWAFVARLFAALIAWSTGICRWGPTLVSPHRNRSHIFSTFSNTVIFRAISAFHAKIVDSKWQWTILTTMWV